MRGKDVAEYLFTGLRDDLGELRVNDETIERDRAVVLFETSIENSSAQGVNVIRIDRSRAIRELTVFFRPLPALSRIAEVIGARMAERFGPRPE
jgi:hypothetical protein